MAFGFVALWSNGLKVSKQFVSIWGGVDYSSMSPDLLLGMIWHWMFNCPISEKNRYTCTCLRVYLFTGLDHWTGRLDWTTGLTLDPKILTKTCNFTLIGNPRMLSYPFSGQEDTDFMLACSKSDQTFMSGRWKSIIVASYFQAGQPSICVYLN